MGKHLYISWLDPIHLSAISLHFYFLEASLSASPHSVQSDADKIKTPY